MADSFIDPETGEFLSEAPPAPRSNVSEFSVSEISGQLKRMVEDTFGRVRVRGEIAGYRGPHSSGHMYFALKDDKARIEAVIWRGVAGRLKHRPEEGMEVVATGKLTTYPGSSKYQIVIEALEPAGAGALMALLEERKKRLEAEGLFAPERKRPLPYLPRSVGVITSPTGAVIRDILHRIMDRYPLRVIVWPVRVQGETTGAEVARAIHGFNALGDTGPVVRPDVLIVARGGGSVEDLWGFNDEAVVRAAAGSAIPLVSAVGHETDWTLIDLAADMRAPTPTGAAEFVVPVKGELDAHLATLATRLGSANTREMENRRTQLRAASRGLPSPDSLFAIQNQQLDAVSARLGRGLVSAIQAKSIDFGRVSGRLGLSLLRAPVERKGQQLDYATSRLARAIGSSIDLQRNRMERPRLTAAMLEIPIREARRKLDYASRMLADRRGSGFERAAARLEQASRLLTSFSHEGTLARGFALLRDAGGNVITRASQTAAGAAYGLSFADGTIDVVRVDGAAAKPAPRKAGAKPKPVAATGGGDQGDLF
ncbi:MAG: exodeoxyribonuclease VII large subunit [Nitratireductor sp.]|nr:exodeoxyribonuclease VII large subunit [Nitratireductor sp.]